MSKIRINLGSMAIAESNNIIMAPKKPLYTGIEKKDRVVITDETPAIIISKKSKFLCSYCLMPIVSVFQASLHW